jgi:hypothetical protein
MRRSTLDVIFSVGGMVLALLALVLGLVLQNQANFADDYVTNQLSAQQIVFTPSERLTDEEKQATCLVTYAGQTLTNGKQAECYANEYIARHLAETNDGKTYAQTSTESRTATAAAEAAAESGAPNAAALQADADEVNTKVQTLFRGETLRGLLLTSYGFSIFGERAQQAAWVAFGVAFVLFVASVAGFVHAFTRPKDEIVT